MANEISQAYDLTESWINGERSYVYGQIMDNDVNTACALTALITRMLKAHSEQASKDFCDYLYLRNV